VSRAQRSTKWCAADPGSLRSVAVPDQRCTASLRCALHRIRDTQVSDAREPYSLFKQPISFSRRVGVRGLRLLLRSPRMRVGGAPRDVRVLGGTPVGRAHNAARQALARRLASHDAGRSPLGAPPWRFWAPGAALLSPAFAPDRLQRAPRTQVVVPGGRGPCLPRRAVTSHPPQDATPRSAFRFALENAPSMSEAGNASSITPNCSQA
jgi:hypothetical protein